MKDKFSQTSDESEDESEGLSDDEEDELVSTMPSSDINNYRPSTRNILSRLTSAHIRQFVSPDFKNDFSNFYVPSLAVNTNKQRSNSGTSSRKMRESLRSKLDMKTLRKMGEKPLRTSTEKLLERKQTKEKRKVKKSILDRLRSPTLSFILKTQRLPEECSGQVSYALRNVSSPCERFNRRNPTSQKYLQNP